ncbi:MAG: WD40 repeat domain-containing protein [Acidobacteriia bacterium]|nr:WD40 repeat domain-containing protein [Terriglobia bacterium]
MAPRRFLNDTDRYSSRALWVIALAVLALLTATCSFSDRPPNLRVPRMPAPPPPLRSVSVPMEALALSSDGNRLLLVDRTQHRVEIADWQTKTEPLPMQEVPCRVVGYVAEFSPDGRRVAHVCHDGQIVVWDASTGRRIFTSDCNFNLRYPQTITWSMDGSRLAAACPQSVFVWDIATGKQTAHFPRLPYDAAVCHLSFTASGQLVSADSQGGLWFWSATGDALRHVRFDREICEQMIMRPDEKEFALVQNRPPAVGLVHDLVLWNPETREMRRLAALDADWPVPVAYSSDGKLLVVNLMGGSAASSAAVFSIAENRYVMTLSRQTLEKGVFRPDGKIVGIINRKVHSWQCCGK